MIEQLSSAQFMEEFLQQLLKDAGMDTVSPEVKEQMLIDLRLRLTDRLFGTLMMNLPEEDANAFKSLLEANSPQPQVEAFLNEKMPGGGELFANALAQFRSDYLGII